MDPTVLRAAFARFPSGVVALSGLASGKPVGMAVSAFASISLEPPLLAASIQRTSTTWPILRGAAALGVSVLAEHQGDVGRRLSGRGDRFTGVDWTTSGSGAVFIQGAAARFDCTLHQEVAAGDHVIALLKVEAVEFRPATRPLVFHGSGFRQLA
ncbi:flavin reductase family protein [Amycolatopsis vastitatis]|uniref:Oxidoreductase n=1 Tax=Amycolatopsis vastitatis TaxID=1905142 RepID=A0A229T1E1_9PSEU|nr:flavin reductase family protein [Amycolatopsis vastitatis]OXM64724.1 oxidoreductase [Amycolatopsis vastitatis]